MARKIMVGMSGGVDSSVAAYLLKKQGYEVTCGTTPRWNPAAAAPTMCGTRPMCANSWAFRTMC